MAERKVIFQLIWGADGRFGPCGHEEFEDVDLLNAFKADLDTAEINYVKVLVGYVLEETQTQEIDYDLVN